VALLVLGDVARDLGDVAEVRQKCEESLATFRELGDPLGEGFSLHNLAVAAYRDGNLDLARSICEESLAIFRCLDVGGATAEVLASLGSILDRVGEPALALDALAEALPLAWRVGPRWVVAAVVEGIAGVAAGQGQDLAAVELASGAAALRSAIGMPVRPNRSVDLERLLTTIRARLGAETFALAQARGQERLMSDVIAAALAVRTASPARVARAEAVAQGDLSTGLSTRERDVLHLLVAGKTDRDIAAALYISPRTASKHVGAILAKLAVASRGEAAVLARQRSLV
jgi:DNA-binding CsgD family transcriptional regulator